MTAEVKKREKTFVEYIKIALREIWVWNYTPLVCIPVVCLALFFAREYYFSSSSNDNGMMAVVYAAVLFLGICMGMVAAGHLTERKRADTYLTLPIGRRRIFILRLITLLFICVVLILVSYVGFYYFTGEDNPTFYEHWAYVDVIAPSEVESLAFRYDGPELWCIYGVRAAFVALAPFILGFGIGAFCATLSSFVVFSVLHALIMLAINALSVIKLGYDYFIETVSPVWFISKNYYGSNNECESYIWCWMIAGAVFMFLAVFTVPYVRAERRFKTFACRGFIVFYAVFILLGALCILLPEYCGGLVKTVVEWIYGIEHPVFKN